MYKFIVNKYQSFNTKEIQSGYRCKTFLLFNNKEKYIYQVYLGDNKYQANKKKYITEIIKRNVNIDQIPNIIDFGENNDFAYLVTDFKSGDELDKISPNQFNSQNFYNSLSEILKILHKIDIGDKFRLDRKRWLRKKRKFL